MNSSLASRIAASGVRPISGTHQESDPRTRDPIHASSLPCFTTVPPTAPWYPLSRSTAVPIIQVL